jgi:type VI secretion system secreted protein VgrG
MSRCSLAPASLVVIAGLLYGGVASAQTPGAAQSFAVLGGSSVTVAGSGSVITGDVGVSPGTSITGLPGGGTVVPPFSTHNNDGAAIAAQTSTTALYTTLAGMGGATALGPELGSTVVTPGVYAFSTTANIASGTTLTLNGAGIYVFKVGSALTANVLSNVLLQNGASPCNIYWQVTSAATLNGVTFSGTVVAQAGVTLGVGASLSGRALTTALGAVTLSGGNTIGGCAAGPACPVITLSPPTLPTGAVGAAYSQTITASGGTAPYSFAVILGTLPAGLTLTAGGVLSGTPTAPGSFTVTIRATDANGCFADIAYTIVITSAPGCPVIDFTPPTLPGGTVGVPYAQTFTGTGGTAPYIFSVTSGTLPTAGPTTFTIRATDANGCFVERAYSVAIATAVPTLPQIFVLLLALGLGSAGYLRLRRRARIGASRS